jgi:hypothetical protein
MGMGFFPFLPVWAEYLIAGLTILSLLVCAGIAIGKSGRHPIWALLLLLPGLQIIVFWLWAYKSWPVQQRH